MRQLLFLCKQIIIRWKETSRRGGLTVGRDGGRRVATDAAGAGAMHAGQLSIVIVYCAPGGRERADVR